MKPHEYQCCHFKLHRPDACLKMATHHVVVQVAAKDFWTASIAADTCAEHLSIYKELMMDGVNFVCQPIAA